MIIKFPPPYTPSKHLVPDLLSKGYAVLNPQDTLTFLGCQTGEVAAWQPSWDRLVVDGFLKDGGSYRRRRHSCFIVDGTVVRQTPHRAHWQPVEYNALHGGMQRLFEPMAPQVVQSLAWRTMLLKLGQLCSLLKPQIKPWFVEAHQFRIDTASGIGRPTPEGAHRDGVDFVFVLMLARLGVKGGESRVFEIDGPAGQRFTMSEPWTLLLLDDERVIHESTPIQPINPINLGASNIGHRDTLVLTYRARGFQDEV
jgi:hypothetical protein